MNVLVATPVRNSTIRAFLKRSREIYESLTFPQKERVLYENDYPPSRRRYGNNARARNELIEKYLKPEHTHVLWMDVDIVEVPEDIIEQLAEVTETDIVAPFVLIEGTERFYDVGGFQQLGCWFDFAWPHCLGGTICGVDSVGSCYLVPAEVYRQGARYRPRGNDVEHGSLMNQARQMGYRVYACRNIVAYHANMDKWEGEWSGDPTIP